MSSRSITLSFLEIQLSKHFLKRKLFDQFDFFKSELYLLPNMVDFRSNTLWSSNQLRSYAKHTLNIPLFATYLTTSLIWLPVLKTPCRQPFLHKHQEAWQPFQNPITLVPTLMHKQKQSEIIHLFFNKIKWY